MRQLHSLLVHYMKIFQKIKFDILISTKTLFYIKSLYNVPVRNKIISQSKIRKTVIKQKFKCYFLLTSIDSKLNKRH